MKERKDAKEAQRENLMAGFHVYELWKRSGAWSHFDDEVVDGLQRYRVTKDDATQLRGLLRELLLWVDRAKFEEIPGARERCAIHESDLSELLEARHDRKFQKLLRGFAKPAR